MASSQKTEKNGIKNFNGIARNCMWILKKQTKVVQEGRIEYFKRQGDQHFTKNGRGAEITIDLVLQARAKMSENKVNGPEDAVASEVVETVAFRESAQSQNVFKIVSWDGRCAQYKEYCEACVLEKIRCVRGNFTSSQSASRNASWVRWKHQVHGRS